MYVNGALHLTVAFRHLEIRLWRFGLVTILEFNVGVLICWDRLARTKYYECHYVRTNLLLEYLQRTNPLIEKRTIWLRKMDHLARRCTIWLKKMKNLVEDYESSG